MAKYKRKTVRRYTVQIPSVNEDGLETTKGVRIPMPCKGITLSDDHKKEVVDAFVSIYLMDGESMDSAASKMNFQRSTLHHWKRDNSEIAKIVENAQIQKKEQRISKERNVARSTAQRLMEGYTVDLESKKMVKILNVNGDEEWVAQEVKIAQQYIKPSEGLVLRRLENDDEHWRKDAGELTKGKQSIPLIAWVGGDDKEEEE
tara:strand:- start:225 stop:833 length:609 start_codon:yes stop_codon:yes gene_type:complete